MVFTSNAFKTLGLDVLLPFRSKQICIQLSVSLWLFLFFVFVLFLFVCFLFLFFCFFFTRLSTCLVRRSYLIKAIYCYTVYFFSSILLLLLLIIMEICKSPTLQLKVVNKYSLTHVMYIEIIYLYNNNNNNNNNNN